MKAGIAHLGLFCSDLEAMRGFYEKYFDGVSGEKYTNPAKGFESYIISFPKGNCQLEIMKRADITAGQTSCSLGLAHISFAVGSAANVDLLTETLRADGFRVIDGPRTTGDGFYESAILDPEENIVEIVAQN